MRKTLILIIGLLFGAVLLAPGLPADATPSQPASVETPAAVTMPTANLQPGDVVNRTWAGCTVQIVYGTFGNAFGDLTPISQSCGGNMSVRIWAAYQGTVTAHTCTLDVAVFHPGQDPNCRFILSTGTIRSTVISDTGGAFRIDTFICGTSCHTFSDGLFG